MNQWTVTKLVFATAVVTVTATTTTVGTEGMTADSDPRRGQWGSPYSCFASEARRRGWDVIATACRLSLRQHRWRDCMRAILGCMRGKRRLQLRQMT
jgi:hypothetical protein